MDRRNFFKTLGAGGATLAAGSLIPTPIRAMAFKEGSDNAIPKTNIQSALDIPRTKLSMPGRYPGRVVEVMHPNSVSEDGTIDGNTAFEMLSKSMLMLTGEKNLRKAWRLFFTNKDRIGLKVNPIGGSLLSTSHQIVEAVIKQLEDAGIPREQIIIWDRREHELIEAGFTAERYPGIRIVGTEYKENDSFYGKDGKLLGENRIDKDWVYKAACSDTYDAYTMPYMINDGEDSYFSSILTKEIDKVINIPVMKNAGTAVTLCMKNLAFGSITNTGRLHSKLWHGACAQVPAFPPLRDKVVLNIADGIIGCYDGGPAANPQFICQYKTILTGTDPVAVDRIGHDIIIGRRIAMGRQKEDNPHALDFMKEAASYGLGVAEKENITHLKYQFKA